MTDAADSRYPVPISKVLDLLGVARTQGLDPDGQRDLVAAIFNKLRPYLVEGPFGIIVPRPDAPETLISRH